jgi:hypothetical protein
MLFDVFFSYTSENRQVVDRWVEQFRAAGLKVFVDSPDAPGHFRHRIEFAMAESRVLMPVVSRAALDSPWVTEELKIRLRLFDRNHCNILPIAFETGLTARVVDGFSAIIVNPDGGDAERARMSEVLRIIDEVRAGKRPPPFRTNWPESRAP